MAKKKVHKKKLSQSPLFSSENQSTLDSLLQDLQTLPSSSIVEKIPDPQVAQALLERISGREPDAPALVMAIQKAFDQKEVQKTAKRALFKFRQMGITIPEVPVPQMEPGSILRKVEQEKPLSFLGPIDGYGSRAFFIRLPQMAQGTELAMGLMNDEQGIIEFTSGRYSKKQAREIQEVLFGKIPRLVTTSLDHVVTLLEKSYALRNSGDGAKGYLLIRHRLLEHVTLLLRPVIDDLLPLENLQREMIGESQIQRLLGHECMQPWIIDHEDMTPLIKEMEGIQGSPLFLTELQKAELFQEIRERALERIFPETRRGILKGRLEEMAYFFYQSGEESLARVSLAASLSLSLFLKRLLDRSLVYYLRNTGKLGKPNPSQGSPTSRIILPP